MREVKVGTILIAHNPCQMVTTKKATLTINKEYTIEDVDDEFEDEIMIIDDENHNHYFPIAEISDFFYFKDELRQKKLKKIKKSLKK